MTAAPAVWRLDDGRGTALAVTARGAAWMSLRVPLAAPGGHAATPADAAAAAAATAGPSREVLLGHARAADHGVEPGYVGSVVGRWANRLGGARLALDGRLLQLAPNEGPHQLHGGPDGFDRRDWRLLAHDPSRLLVLGLHSPDGDQGFPGALDAQVTYAIVAPGVVELRFEAVCDAPTACCLTTHAYINLDGGGDAQAGPGAISAHRLRLRASRVLPVDAALIPTGPPQPLDGHPLDLRRADEPLGERVIDHCYVLDAAAVGGAEPAAEIASGDGRLRLRLFTDYPALQLYTGHLLGGTRDRGGRPFAARSGFALEPEFLPDAPNHPEWGGDSGVLRPGQRLARRVRYVFEAVPA